MTAPTPEETSRAPGSLAGKVAVVTGAARGIGRSIAEHLVDGGAAVVAADLSPGPPLDGATPLTLDITDAVGVQRALDGVGAVDIVVNAAGVYGDLIRTDRIEPAMWDRYLRANLSGHFYVTRAVLSGMADRQWGRIVNIASIASTDGGYRQAHYASAKAGLVGLTRSVALEFADRGITCNAVLPGPIATDKVLASPPEVIDGMLEWVPAGRLGEPEEVAALVAFLCSPAASYLNGASIPVDGASMLLQFRFARRSRR